MSYSEKGILVILAGLEVDLPIEIEYDHQLLESNSLEYQGCSEGLLLEDVLLNGVSIIGALNEKQIKAIENRLLDTLKTNQDY